MTIIFIIIESVIIGWIIYQGIKKKHLDCIAAAILAILLYVIRFMFNISIIGTIASFITLIAVFRLILYDRKI
jgi:hypothetical protein